MTRAHTLGRLRAATLISVGVMALLLSSCSNSGNDTNENQAASGKAGDAATCNADDPVTWKHGILNPGSEAGFLLMAKHRGLFEKYGVDVKYVQFASGAQIFPALVAGEVDSIEASPGALFPAAAQGAGNFRVTGSTMPGLPYAIYAREGIDSIDDLKGKTMAISAKGALPDQIARAILSESGVDPDTLQYVNAGSNADRYRAVVAGSADAASSPMDYVPQAKQDGVHAVALSPDVVPDFPRYTVIANTDALDERPDGMTCFLAAMAEGIQYAVENPDKAKALTAQTLDVGTDDPIVTYMTKRIIEEELVAPQVEIPREKVEYMQKLMIDLGQIKEPIDLDTYLDDSYRKQAMKILDKG